MLRSLQACRAFAALLVVLYHTSYGMWRPEKYFGYQPFGQIFDFGFAGVDFFFVLSGFIILHIHADDIGKPRALGAYLWKRFSRIYPAYWVIFLLVLPIYLLVPSYGFGYERDPDVFVRAFWLFPHPQSHVVLTISWTLVHEIFFYVLFGLLILNKRVGLAVFLVWGGCVIAFACFDSFPWTFLFSAANVRFLAGMGVALTLRRWRIPAPRLLAVVGAAVFLATGYLDAYHPPRALYEQTIGYTLGSVLILAGVVEAERSGLLRPPSWLVYLGDASYSIYLVHFVPLSIFAKFAKAWSLDAYVPGGVLFILHAASSVAVGCLFYHVVEHPLHIWTKRFFRRQKAEAGGSTVVVESPRQAA
jgi:exopolysaccharide production protein ExoZ